MAVPNTVTFTLLDVKTEIENEGGGTVNTLSQAFTNANLAHFDPAYKDKPTPNSLLSFRNYGGGGAPLPDCSSWVFNSAGPFPMGESLTIKYVDCNNNNQIIQTSNSAAIDGLEFCVKRIYEVDMGTFTFDGYKLSSGEYNSSLGELSGGTANCTSPPLICYEWTLEGTSVLDFYELSYIDCNGVQQDIISDTLVTWPVCAREILSYDLGSITYDKTIDGPLAPGEYVGSLATLSGGTIICV